MSQNNLADKTIVIMAGGTGGHVFPALAVAEMFRSRGAQVHWLGTKAGIESRIVPAKDIPISYMKVSGVRGQGAMRKILAPYKVLTAVVQALSFLARIKPNVVLGMGGFVSGPGGIAAWILRRPLVIHEQNAVPGFTNRLLARFSRLVLQAFPGAFDEGEKVRTVGNPVREEFSALQEVEARYSGRSGPLRILVVGGSQGAQALNENVPAALAMLEGKVEVRHQAGKGKAEVTSGLYEAAGLNANVSEFIDDIAACYEWADMVVCRAGALTVSEIALSGVPAVFVPYPHAVDDHQTKNAAALVDLGAASLIRQSELTPASLKQKIEAMGSRDNLKLMAQKAKEFGKPESTLQVLDACLEVARA